MPKISKNVEDTGSDIVICDMQNDNSTTEPLSPLPATI